MNRHPPARRAFAGFTLVETMVAIVIGMLATLIVMGVYATSEGQKRTITGGADAQSDAAVVLYLMERDLRQAGYGLAPNPDEFVPAYTAPPGGVLTNGILAQCANVRAYHANWVTPDFVYGGSTFAPVVINPGATIAPAGDTGTDVVLVNYGANNGVIGKGVLIDGLRDTGGNLLNFQIGGVGSPDPRAGFVQGDMVLAVPAPGSGFDCTLNEVTGLPGGANCSVSKPANIFIERNNTAYSSYYTRCAAGPAVSSAWNKVGGDDVDYSSGKLYNLGPVSAFVSRVYAVRKGNLTVCDLTVNDCSVAGAADPPDNTVWVPIANDVVGFKAMYGKDTDLNGAVNSWGADAPVGGAAPFAQVIAVRLAVVVRSGQYEKEVVTAANPVWHLDATGTADVTFDLTNDMGGDWDHYRYKTAQSIVPLRDMIWGQQNAN